MEKKKEQKIIELFFIKNGEKIAKVYLKVDDISLTCVLEKLIEVSFKDLKKL